RNGRQRSPANDEDLRGAKGDHDEDQTLMDPKIARAIADAAGLIASADGLVIAAGAGMGVDSGLPDFRGTHGFWRAYPPYARLGLTFIELANPHWFDRDPTLAWGFYGHRSNLFPSNVDGHFQRAGFDPERVLEVHGSIEWLQCTRNCGNGAFPAGGLQIAV